MLTTPDEPAERWCFASIDALGDAYRRGEVSPVDVLEATRARIRRHDGGLRAYCELAGEAASEAAHAAARRWRAGRPLGALDGVPVSIKDHIDVAGMRSPRGRALEAARPAAADSPVTARLREAGAVIVGKTTMPELPVIPDTATAAFGVTRNPLDPGRTPGGSSGGAAAAVAAGLCVLAIGSDGGGSIRLPAAYTGLVGHKPTLGRVPYFPGPTDRTVAGPIARRVADVAHAMSAIARPDGRDWMELARDEVDYVAALGAGLRGLRLGFSPDYGFVPVSAEVARVVEAAVASIARAGAEVRPLGRVCDDAFDAWIAQASIRFAGEPLPEGSPRAVASVYEFARSLTVRDVQRMLDARNSLGVQLLQALRDCDFVVSPTVPVVAPAVGTSYPDGDSLSDLNRSLLGFTCPWNLVHMPAVSIPCGRTPGGLPVGLQLAGPKGSDAAMIAAAAAIEALLSGSSRS